MSAHRLGTAFEAPEHLDHFLGVVGNIHQRCVPALDRGVVEKPDQRVQGAADRSAGIEGNAPHGKSGPRREPEGFGAVTLGTESNRVPSDYVADGAGRERGPRRCRLRLRLEQARAGEFSDAHEDREIRVGNRRDQIDSLAPERDLQFVDDLAAPRAALLREVEKKGPAFGEGALARPGAPFHGQREVREGGFVG